MNPLLEGAGPDRSPASPLGREELSNRAEEAAQGSFIDASRRVCDHRYMDESPANNFEEPIADLDFLRVFLPYELRLAQRRAMVSGSQSSDGLSSSCLGLYLIRLEPISGPSETIAQLVQ